MKAKILGVAASLRNARWGIGPEKLIKDIQEIKTQKSLFEFLQKEADIHLNQFVEAGRKDGIPFDQLYGNLRRKRSESGLSNSEIILAAALWAARQNGAEIDYLSLTDHFSMTREVRNQEALKEKLLQADGILLSTPVYFGDRGSLAHDFIEIIKADDELVRSFSEKVYGGLAVGAKRNGGQETTLIYQLLDMVNLGSFGVGNDSESTSQYGGTSHAGDVGTGAKDTYGLNTSIGTGKRVASIANLLQAGETHQLKNKARIQFWILQDHEDKAENLLKKIILESKTLCNPEIINLTSAEIKRCIACDICPTHIDIDEIYRCIIHKSPLDELETHHAKFVDVDAIIPVVYSGKDMETRQSNYQRFIERTRYLRRGDYLFTNVLTAPLVFEEVETQENMHIRMLTSMIRHHTILV
ncbi:MAG: NAD(P)H-dependent oxidoreductase, partial [Nitrospinota bacterium]|nr:NAD(P)H-dependent oxidoreductase [Nitrospinota bacterium]